MDAKLAVYGDGANKVASYLENKFGFLVMDSLLPIEDDAYAYLGFEPNFPLCLLGKQYADIANLVPYGCCSREDFIYAYKMLQSAIGKEKRVADLLQSSINHRVDYCSLVVAGPLCAAEKERLRKCGFELVSAGNTVLSQKHIFTGKSEAYLYTQVLCLDIFKPDLVWS